MRGNGKILAVEDDPNDQALLSRAFRKAGCADSVVLVSSVAEARQYLKTTTPSGKPPIPRVVLLDLKLPGESGLDLISWLRGSAGPLQHVPVVLLTSSHEQNDIRKAYELGATGFFVKPADFEVLQSMVETLAAHWVAFNQVADL